MARQRLANSPLIFLAAHRSAHFRKKRSRVCDSNSLEKALDIWKNHAGEWAVGNWLRRIARERIVQGG